MLDKFDYDYRVQIILDKSVNLCSYRDISYHRRQVRISFFALFPKS